jgi:transglutaminase-like putative cysteine protease
VEAIVHWLARHFSWKETDYQRRTLQQIIERRGGNCNDFATVALAAMTELGIRPRKVHDIHIRTESTDRGARAKALVKEKGNLYSVFGRHHNDHIWLEVYDSNAGEWFPVDPWGGVVGMDEWIKARVWFGSRTSLNPDAEDMIVPFAIFAADQDGRFTIDRTRHYVVEEFDRFYGGKLRALPMWKQWTALVEELDDKAKGAFAGTVDLHEYESQIDSVADVYEQLRLSFQGQHGLGRPAARTPPQPAAGAPRP